MASTRSIRRTRRDPFLRGYQEELRIRPTQGFVVLGDGTRQCIENTDDLRVCVIDVAGQIRAARAGIEVPIPVNTKPGQCRPCGMRRHCGQARI